jgi:hypothetical protein
VKNAAKMPNHALATALRRYCQKHWLMKCRHQLMKLAFREPKLGFAAVIEDERFVPQTKFVKNEGVVVRGSVQKLRPFIFAIVSNNCLSMRVHRVLSAHCAC